VASAKPPAAHWRDALRRVQDKAGHDGAWPSIALRTSASGSASNPLGAPFSGLWGCRAVLRPLRLPYPFLASWLLGALAVGVALPSSAPGQTPAEAHKKEGSAGLTPEPCAVRLTSGRSGRTPAEPYPPRGPKSLPRTKPHRPVPDHPWRNSYKAMTGHF